jgi:membrane protein required for colicin V production
MNFPDVTLYNPLDWLLIALVAYSTIAALMRGFFREVFSLIGLIAGILLASWNYSLFSAYLARLLPWTIAQIAAFLLIVIITTVLCGLAGSLLSKTAKTIGLGFFDRLLGGAFGLVRGGLMGVALLMALVAFIPHETYVKNSHLAGYFLHGAHAVSFVVPTHLQQQIREGVLQLHHKS